MCKSRAQGGKRCFGHAVGTFDNAQVAYATLAEKIGVDTDPSRLGETVVSFEDQNRLEAARRRLDEAGIELGSSDKGRDYLEALARARKEHGDGSASARLRGYISGGADYELRRAHSRTLVQRLAPGKRKHQEAVSLARSALFGAAPVAAAAGPGHARVGIGAAAVVAAIQIVRESQQRKTDDMDQSIHLADNIHASWRKAHQDPRLRVSEDGWTTIAARTRG